MTHPALPQKMTKEKLAQWITDNQVERRTHDKEVQLTQDQIHEYEAKVAHVTAAIYNLINIEKAFRAVIKFGTGMKDEVRQPQDFTIPPTKGTKELEANRQHYSKILEDGYVLDITNLYGIPYPEEKTILFFDIEGNEFDQYNTPMSDEQESAYGKLFDGGSNPLSV